jgi:hypothetical protein
MMTFDSSLESSYQGVGARLMSRNFGNVCPSSAAEVSQERTAAGRMKKQPSEFQSHQRFKIKKLISFEKDRTFSNIDLKSTTLRAFPWTS